MFKSVTGVNISDYVVSKRINYACALLRDRGTPIREVAEKCGFSNIGTFYSNFKKKTGESPERYRKMLIAGASLSDRGKKTQNE